MQVLVIADPNRDRQGAADPNDDRIGATGWSACEAQPGNIIVTCLKLAEDSDDIIVRAYECAGQLTAATFTLGFDVRGAADTDLLERATPDVGRVTVAGRQLTTEFKPYEIRTLRLSR
jgi:alpha-mannosidase